MLQQVGNKWQVIINRTVYGTYATMAEALAVLNQVRGVDWN